MRARLQRVPWSVVRPLAALVVGVAVIVVAVVNEPDDGPVRATVRSDGCAVLADVPEGDGGSGDGGGWCGGGAAGE